MQEWRHGTRTGYNRHLYSDGKPCDACREANARAQQRYRARKRAERGKN